MYAVIYRHFGQHSDEVESDYSIKIWQCKSLSLAVNFVNKKYTALCNFYKNREKDGKLNSRKLFSSYIDDNGRSAQVISKSNTSNNFVFDQFKIIKLRELSEAYDNMTSNNLHDLIIK